MMRGSCHAVIDDEAFDGNSCFRLRRRFSDNPLRGWRSLFDELNPATGRIKLRLACVFYNRAELGCFIDRTVSASGRSSRATSTSR